MENYFRGDREPGELINHRSCLENKAVLSITR